MTRQGVPTIFSPSRRSARQARAVALGRRADAARWLLGEMERDCIERLDFMRLEPSRTLVIASDAGELCQELEKRGSAVTHSSALDEEKPFTGGHFDLIVSLARLDTVNDLPGALLHLRNALSEGGLLIAQLTGAGTLPMLRQVLLKADGERPSARIHPQVDNRAATALLERAGFARQVVDTHCLKASYRSLDRLVADLREQGLTNVLADPPPPLGKTALARAHAAFDSLKDNEGRMTESFEILTLTGWR